MIGAVLAQARKDAASFSASAGFQVQATLTTPDGLTSITVNGLGTGTWMTFDDMRSGKPVSSTSNSFNIPLAQLIAGNYPYLNTRGGINLNNHKVTITDSDGNLGGTFVINEQHPNSTFGLIVCILGRAA